MFDAWSTNSIVYLAGSVQSHQTADNSAYQAFPGIHAGFYGMRKAASGFANGCELEYDITASYGGSYFLTLANNW